MLFKSFCCTDLKTGVCIYAITMLVVSVISPYASSYYEDRRREEDPYTRKYQAIFLLFASGVRLANIVAAVSLAFGAIKEDRKLLLPHLILQGICLTFSTAVFVYLSCKAPIMLLFLLIIAPCWYLWLCVLSFFQSLNPNKRNCAPQTIPSDDAVVYVDQPPFYEECPQNDKNTV